MKSKIGTGLSSREIYRRTLCLAFAGTWGCSSPNSEYGSSAEAGGSANGGTSASQSSSATKKTGGTANSTKTGQGGSSAKTTAGGTKDSGGEESGGADSGGSDSGGADAVGGKAAGGVKSSAGGAKNSSAGGAKTSSAGGAKTSAGGAQNSSTTKSGTSSTGGKATGGTSSTGGTKAVGGTKATGAGGSSVATTDGEENIFTVGPFTGAGWVAGGADLTKFTNPTIDGETQTFSSKTNLCMSASIPALQTCGGGVTCADGETKNYAENWGAMLALNTSETEGTPKGTQFSNIAVTFTGAVTPATAQVRLQMETKDGSTYCVHGYASGLQVQVTDFIKNCYDTKSTTALTKAETANVTSIQLSIASGDAAETVTNLCMTDIKLDGTTSTTPTTTCNDTSTASGTLTGAHAYQTIATSNGSKSYVLQSNWWGTYDNQSEVYSGVGFTVNGSGTFRSPSDPLGYPSLFIGTYSGQTSVGSNLPKQVSSLTTIPTLFQWSGASDVTHFNASYDVWFTASNAKVTTGDPGAGGAYLMVWMFKPDQTTPRGSKVATSVSIPGAPGTWEVWMDNTNPPCVSYMANTKLSTISFDLNQFIKNAVSNNWGVKNSQYLSIIFGGFEIWEGHSGLKLEKFCAQV